jgi:Holliday junction resolvase RusA-like endonuclease
VSALVFAAAGTPRPQGSKTIGRAGRGGRPIILEGRNSTQRAAFHEWRDAIVASAWAAQVEARRTTPLLGPVRVELLFAHKRPGSARKGDRWRSASPDIDKLARACLDALTIAGVIGDDAQVAELVARKVHALPDEAPGLVVTISPLTHDKAPESSPELCRLHTKHDAGTAGTRPTRSH